MSLDELLKGLSVFKQGMQELAQTTALNDANQQIMQLNAQALDEKEKLAQINQISQGLASRLMGTGGMSADKAATAVGIFGPSQGAQFAADVNRGLQESTQAFTTKENEKDRALRRELMEGQAAQKETRPSELQKVREREAAKVVSSWIDKGQKEVVFGDVAKLQEVEKMLEAEIKKGSSVTGGLTSYGPDWLKSAANPKLRTIETKVRSVTQKNLREILGGQFAEREGEKLINTAADVRLSPPEYLKAVRELRVGMEAQADAKDRMATYAQEKGTLEGFTPPKLKVWNGSVYEQREGKWVKVR